MSKLREDQGMSKERADKVAQAVQDLVEVVSDTRSRLHRGFTTNARADMEQRLARAKLAKLLAEEKE